MKTVFLIKVNIFFLGSPKFPVLVYKEFLKRRPKDCCQPESRFYLKPIPKPKSATWFSKQPLGTHSIVNIAKKMAISAGLSPANRSNHSGRKMAIQTLLHDVPPTDVVQISGHKNVQSLNSYSYLSTSQQKAISKIISDKISSVSTSNVAASVNNASSSNDDIIDDAVMNEMLCEWMPETDDQLNLSLTSNSVNSSNKCLESHIGTKLNSPNISMLNGTINGNITININYNGQH
jgi:hypothetical protein